MKEVLKLLVNEDGGFSWAFSPEADQKTLPPFTLCAALVQLQSIVQGVMANQSRQEQGLMTADKSLLNMLHKRNGN